jgi:hypothetical protein
MEVKRKQKAKKWISFCAFVLIVQNNNVIFYFSLVTVFHVFTVPWLQFLPRFQTPSVIGFEIVATKWENERIKLTALVADITDCYSEPVSLNESLEQQSIIIFSIRCVRRGTLH